MDSFGTAATLTVGDDRYRMHRLAGVAPADLPYSLRILLENLLRHEAEGTADQILALLDRRAHCSRPDRARQRRHRGHQVVHQHLQPGGHGRRGTATVHAGSVTFRARVRLDTPREAEFHRHGGILPYVLRRILHRG